MSPRLAAMLAPGLLATRLVWFAMAAALPVYVVVARFAAPHAAGAVPPPALLATFITLAIGLTAAALALPRAYPSEGLLARLVAQEPSAEAIAPALAPGHVDTAAFRELDPIERRLLLIAPVFRAQALTRAALGEAIGMVGLVLALLAGSFLYAIPFAALAALVLVLAFPRIEPLVERARPLVRL